MKYSLENLIALIKTNPDIIETLMSGKFNWETFIQGTRNFGVKIDLSDIEKYLDDKLPFMGESSESHFFVQDQRANEFRQLRNDEIFIVSGGSIIDRLLPSVTMTAAVAAVAVASTHSSCQVGIVTWGAGQEML
ncbi:hypothetical protein [Alishewanella sp. HH-ZS]|uniref:hypothetical protein n=1 Tax=Alishewanella sp. HH-ZS TaxID=1856684 RepID=UPI0008236A80|nr:hypothetical protein [Alishewanella sp. HH-ZS]OCW96217.1 hypothetical protein A9165_12835 [Alishewanella sp. HH-ZS]